MEDPSDPDLRLLLLRRHLWRQVRHGEGLALAPSKLTRQALPPSTIRRPPCHCCLVCACRSGQQAD